MPADTELESKDIQMSPTKTAIMMLAPLFDSIFYRFKFEIDREILFEIDGEHLLLASPFIAFFGYNFRHDLSHLNAISYYNGHLFR